MKAFIVYDPASGELTKAGYCEESDFDLQSPGGNIIEFEGSKSTHYVADGVPTAYTEAQMFAKSQRPPMCITWSNETMSWLDSRTLEQLKDAKWSEIKFARETYISSNLETPYGSFDGDAEGRTNIANAVLLSQTLVSVGQPQDIDFTLADNTVVSLTPAQMVTVGILLGAKVQTARAAATQLRTQIETATQTELEEITWPSTL